MSDVRDQMSERRCIRHPTSGYPPHPPIVTFTSLRAVKKRPSPVRATTITFSVALRRMRVAISARPDIGVKRNAATRGLGLPSATTSRSVTRSATVIGLSTVTASGTAAPFSAISGRSIAIRPGSGCFPPVNLATASLASPGVARARPPAAHAAVPTPNANTARRLNPRMFFSFANRDNSQGRLAVQTPADWGTSPCPGAVLGLYGYPYISTHMDGYDENDHRDFRRAAARSPQAGGPGGSDAAGVGGTRAAPGHRRNQAAAVPHARRAFQRELAPPRGPRLVVGPDHRDVV